MLFTTRTVKSVRLQPSRACCDVDTVVAGCEAHAVASRQAVCQVQHARTSVVEDAGRQCACGTPSDRRPVEELEAGAGQPSKQTDLRCDYGRSEELSE